jgi:hypothetical protein
MGIGRHGPARSSVDDYHHACRQQSRHYGRAHQWQMAKSAWLDYNRRRYPCSWWVGMELGAIATRTFSLNLWKPFRLPLLIASSHCLEHLLPKWNKNIRGLARG